VSPPSARDLRAAFGEEPLVSDWLEVMPEAMQAFADATRDHDWMHLDPERAREAGLGGTIAFGFWTLSMLSHFMRDALGREYPPGVAYGFNYGLDRVRFVTPVPVGSRIRNRLTVRDVSEAGEGRFLVRTRNEVEIEGEARPAMVAEWLVQLVMEGGEDGAGEPGPRPGEAARGPNTRGAT